MSELTREHFEEVVKGLATKADLGGLATKEELNGLATKQGLKSLATKEDLKSLAAKEEIKGLATKPDLHELKAEFRHQGIKFEALEKRVDTVLELLTPYSKTRKSIRKLEDRMDQAEEDIFVLKKAVGE